MKGKAFGVMLAALSSGGCASMALGQYVGRSVDEMAQRYGPPSSSMLMPDGSTAFRWVFSATSAPEARAPLDMFMPVATAPLARREAANRNGLIGGMCTYSVRARWEEAGKLWRIIRYDAPRADCG